MAGSGIRDRLTRWHDKAKTHRYHGSKDLVDEGDRFWVLAEDHGRLDEVPLGVVTCIVLTFVEQI